jgi:hypothetical protein
VRKTDTKKKREGLLSGSIASPGVGPNFGQPLGQLTPFEKLRQNQELSGIVGETARRTIHLHKPKSVS